MSTALAVTQTNEKIVELLEALIEQHARSEVRREAAIAEQTLQIQQLQAELRLLFSHGTGGTPSQLSAVPTAKVLPKSAHSSGGTSRDAAPASAALDDWEREKERLLRQWSEGDDQPGPWGHETAVVANHVVSVEEPPLPANGQSHEWLDYLEHLDPDDPALHDEKVRRHLVAQLRRIEVELSLERAHLARQRTELESRIIDFDHDQRILESKQLAAKSPDGKLPWRFGRLLGNKRK